METKRAVDQLSNFLNRANYNTIAIHGDKQQFQRLVNNNNINSLIKFLNNKFLGCHPEIFKRRSSNINSN